LDALVAASRDARVGAVGSRRLRPDGTIAHAGVAFGGRDLPFKPWPFPLYPGAPADAPHVSHSRAMSAVAGSGLLVRRAAFVEAGGFDEAFRMWVADADLCLALRARGRAIHYCAESVVVEDGDPTRLVDAGDVLRLSAKSAGPLSLEDEAVCRIDGTRMREVYGLQAPPPRETDPEVVWTADFAARSGYVEEARGLVVGLNRLGIPVSTNPLASYPQAGAMPPAVAAELRALERRTPADGFIHVIQMPVAFASNTGRPDQSTFRRHPRAVWNVGRTMFESDRLPAAWVGPCNEMDEIWVPSTFNVETFSRSGVAREKLFVVPGALPLVSPEATEVSGPPLVDVPEFVFLSVFAWVWRKGWDVLVRAYLEEFRRDEKVLLLLHVSPTQGPTIDPHRADLEQLITADLGRRIGAGPRIAMMSRTLSGADMARLYRSANAFVLPTRGEGFGRPFMEAMAAGLPVIGTRWSGHLDFMNDDNAYLIDYRMVEVNEKTWRVFQAYHGHQCAEPSVPHLRVLMRRVFEERTEAAAKGVRGQREVMERFDGTRVARLMAERLARGGARPRPAAAPRPLQVTWEGPQFVHFGMAVVNRELCRVLADDRSLSLSLLTPPPEGPDAPGDERLESLVRRLLPAASDVHVRHQWPPRFDPPADGHWVMIQPWEFGALPRAWIEPINRLVDEVWVPSSFVRSCFVRSGVDPRRVVVVPNGVDPARFHPGAPPLPLPTSKRFRFLFVGGTLARKGADILIETYLATFRREDDVCLVIKDLGAESFYRGQGLRDRLRAIAADPSLPEVLYLEDDLAESELPGLYTACQSLVHPFRGEGFALPVVEAMACGLAVVVPGCGPALELCDPATAYLVPASEVRLPEARVGGLETVDLPSLAEPDRPVLASTMRHVFEHPEEARAIGGKASARAHGELSWSRAAQRVKERLRGLASRPVRRHVAPPWPSRRRLSVCMIVRNEEDKLAACLASLQGAADEIVVVDTGSTDRTVEIAQAHGAQVHHARWTDDWAAARNVSLGEATGDWILVVDADQTLEPSSRGELRRLIQHDAPVGYLVRQLNYMDEAGRSVVEHLTVRLFPNRQDVRYVGRIHEQIVSRRPEMELELIPCGVILHHHGYRAASTRRGKAERDLPILERLVAEEGADAFAFYNLGVTYHVLGRAPEAEASMRRALALAAPAAAGLAAPAFLLTGRLVLAATLLAQRRPAQAAEVCRETLALAPEFADAWCTLGAAELVQERYEAAAAAYRSALGCSGMTRATVTDRATSGWKAWLGLGEAELRCGRWRSAVQALDRAYRLSAATEEAARALSVAVAEGRRQGWTDPLLDRAEARLRSARGDLDGALAHLRRALEHDATDADTLVATGEVLLALGASDEAVSAFQAALRFRPGWPDARRGLEAAATR
jgi:glycosyltransferase involved in cell wall biosynthesis/GT2 family glycosyltransferase/tetratricopeptide (TPR) repeat protein